MDVRRQHEANEVGKAPARNLPSVPIQQATAELAELLKGAEIPANALVFGAPETCPACGAATVLSGLDESIQLRREDVHPLVWHPTQAMADTWICTTCDAAWVEDAFSEGELTWVRPYWVVR